MKTKLPAQASEEDKRYTSGGVFVPNDIAWGIVGSTGHARKKAVDALHALLKAAPEAPARAESNCIQCRNADSWGLPDQPVCKTCVVGSAWTPLNADSVNPNKPAQDMLTRCRYDGHCQHAVNCLDEDQACPQGQCKHPKVKP